LQKARTALHWAASEGHGDVVEALLKASCSKDIQDEVYASQTKLLVYESLIY
jgi:ankyrin repeat protein